MAELIDRDQEHLRLLKLAYYLIAGAAALAGLFSLIYVDLGSLLGSGVHGFPHIDLGMLVLAWLTARSLRDRRHRTFCLVIAALSCLQIPWGTAVGVCTFMVLNRPSVKALFSSAGDALT